MGRNKWIDGKKVSEGECVINWGIKLEWFLYLKF